MSILNLVRPELLSNSNYNPGGDEAEYRLHANELPWSPVAMNNVALNFYPQAQAHLELQKKLAQRYNVAAEELILTRGGDDAIDLIVRLFLRAGIDAFMQCSPTFSMYEFYVRLQGGFILDCPLDASNEFELTLEAIIATWQQHCKIIMLCNPNNPTGTLVSLDLIAATCAYFKNRSVVVVDEAYIEFSGTASAATILAEHDNLIVLKTMSKAAGLAGLRLGSIIAQKQVIERLVAINAPYNLSSAVIDLALRALANHDWFAQSVQEIQQAREWLSAELHKQPLIEQVYPSFANFILFKSAYAQELINWCAEHKIAVKGFKTASLLQQHVRLTVGSAKQNRRVLAVLSSFKP